ncbi:acid-sensing ion channel 2-like [Triplophysa dalaica]|uniref:acid-sensing ion channel 2-like n=1 Tax=Triplophysa dalaica TaxID=1582913 RepID=UPI0024DFD122|nr:acid-sensing ion channel 2-like [Triplophysa dalaica]
MDLKESCGSEASRETGSMGGPSSWQSFTHSSTLHGLRFIFPYSSSSHRSASRRLLWGAALLASLVLLVLESTERLAYFLTYPQVTSVDAVVSGSLVFPAVTVCNLNAYRFTRLTQNDLYHAGELLALLDVHLQIPDPQLAEPHVLAFLTEKSNFTNYRPKAFSMLEFTERVGHDLKEMMLYCRFQGQECSHRDFKTVSYLPICLASTAVVNEALVLSSTLNSRRRAEGDTVQWSVRE